MFFGLAEEINNKKALRKKNKKYGSRELGKYNEF